MKKSMESKFKIDMRPMSHDDLEVVMAIEREVFPDPWTKRMFEEQIDDENWGGIIAESDRKIMGYACYYVCAGEGHLTNIAVRKEFRRKSVAKQLLNNILSIALENNCEYVLLEVRPSNEGAIKFYEKFGFKELYTRPEYYHSPVEEALVMVRYF